MLRVTYGDRTGMGSASLDSLAMGIANLHYEPVISEPETVILWRPTGPDELALVALVEESG